MKLIAAFLGVLFAAQLGQGLASTPVSRVVELLASLQKKLEAELKTEEDLFAKYECWYKTVTSSKTASNQAADVRISDLEAYIADIDAGKIDFTTEEADLTKQVSDLKAALEAAKAMREKEQEDYEAAKQEMLQALNALDEAITVLKAGMGESLTQTTKSANLLSFRAGLKQAVQLAGQSLSAEDARFIEAVLNGQEPIMKDWKKLNRDATFKMKYEARSGKILQVLQQLQATFSSSLTDAEKEEAEAAASYASLKAGKEKILEKTEAALIALEKEHGARALSREEASDEVAALEAQMAADEAFITQVETAYNTKAQEWTAREDLRRKEIAAVSQAIQILHGDDARDQFKKSFASQGYSFLQEDSESSVMHKLAKLAVEKNIPSLSLLVNQAKSMAGNTTAVIGLVVEKIDELVETLGKQQTQDLANKEKCESDLATTKQEARMQSLAIDDYTDEIVRLNIAAADLLKEIEAQEESIKQYNETITTMNRTREDEHTAFQKDVADDNQAVQLIALAINTLERWEEDIAGTTTVKAPILASFIALSSVHTGPQASRRGTSGLQVRREAQAPGEAPLPPPATWSAPYAGASGESQGILSLLALIQEDIEKDITLATTAENAAQAAYEGQLAQLRLAIQAAESTITTLTGNRALKLQAAIDAGTNRGLKKEELDASFQQIYSMTPGCNFILVHYGERREKRIVEMDGLRQAKTILQGGILPEMLQKKVAAARGRSSRGALTLSPGL
mmetsp:Transcript_42623/g.97806  ORF Transcript_42623/g.97806 Transcript_42623/m.97806 type:complete len:742 (-) Transcript_42623:24-2249(-)